jgi:SecD/SecF fusion protein
MDRNLWIRLGVIVAVLGVSAYLLLPTYTYFSKYQKLSPDQVQKLSDTERREYQRLLPKAMKLGLDLQGGMHVVLEMDESKGKIQNKSDAQDRVLEILQTRVDKFGVTEPTITKQGDSRIMVQLPGVDDPGRVREIIQNTAQLEFRLLPDQQDVVRALEKIDEAAKLSAPAPAPTPPASAGKDSTKTAAADTTFPSLTATKPESPAASDPNAPFRSLFVAFRNGALYVPDDGARVARVDEILSRDAVKHAIPAGIEFLWGGESGPRTQDGLPSKALYVVNTRVELKGDRLEDARPTPDPNRPNNWQISFRLDRRGARQFAKVTEANVNHQLAIVLDNMVKSAPNILSKIPGGEGVIEGSFTDREAKDLAIVLRAGALPVKLNFIEERTVGPTLGQDSLKRGLTASLVGLGISILFMIVYYKLSGALAAIGLALNMFIVLAVMAAFHAALSLPGIAGLVLSVAMAVDANVLIFERIREELRKAKTVSSAIEAGYKNAFSAIFDSNLTTVFGGIVLLYFGTGPVKGFAVTLCIGITVSMFTALYVTRFVYDALTRHRKMSSLSI